MSDPFKISGFSLLRLISDRERSRVFLARSDSGGFSAVKLHQPRHPADLVRMTERDAKLRGLSRQDGLLEISACGTTPDGWTWKALPLADNFPGLPPLDSEAGVQQYTPLNLQSWRAANGDKSPSARTVAEWGKRLADALAVLHEGGLVHRDVKPANVLFLHGRPCLGDYGLVGEPGEEVDYSGTEGFQPLEGTSDKGADLYALGKTLYETWTGGNRLEFPSLPRETLEAPDWDPTGSHLNFVLLQACHSQPRKRFRTAQDFSAALANVVVGHRPVHRRRWLATVAGCSVVGVGLFVVLNRPKAPIKLAWRRVRQKGFNVECWQGHSGTADWQRGRMFSYCVDPHGSHYQAVDLADFSMTAMDFTKGPAKPSCTFLHPQTRELWLMEGGAGTVHALNPEAREFRQLGGGPPDDRHFQAFPYWNPLSNRVGIFGGYGRLAVRNDRLEFDPVSKSWIELEPDRDGPGPWRRSGAIPLMTDATGRKLYLVGGYGSRSGKQGTEMPGIRAFGGQFHFLDDVWELDLEANSWRCVLPLGALHPVRLRAAAYFPAFQGLVLLEGLEAGASRKRPTIAWLLRADRDKKPIALQQEGEISRLATAWSWTIDPNNGEWLMFADDGIFRISLLQA